MMSLNRRILASMRLWLCLALWVPGAAFAQTNPPAEPAASVPSMQIVSTPRPKVALVLSGGGARGFAHLGVLKVLQEQRVPIDMVIGTSMGSIVGGAWAAGHRLDDLRELVQGTDWDAVFAATAPRRERDYRRRSEDLNYLTRFSFGVSREGLVLPRGTFQAHELDSILRKVALPVQHRTNLDELSVPFRAVATDLVSGEMVVLRDASLFAAMRASMSIPGAFAPIEIRDQLLIDGGLVRNLPVDVARKLGADVIIAVNVGTPLTPRHKLKSALDVAQQMVNILTEKNVMQSLGELGPQDILISPDLAAYSFSDFAAFSKIEAAGEVAARSVQARLAALGIDAERFAGWEAARTGRPNVPEPIRIDDVRILGTSFTNPQVLLRELDIRPGESYSIQDITSGMRRLSASGDFDRVDFSIAGPEGARRLLVTPSETLVGPNTLRFGGRLESDFRNNNRFEILALHTLRWVNSYGAELRTLLRVGSARELGTEFYQPLSLGREWFVTANAGVRGDDFERRLGNTGFTAALGSRTYDIGGTIGYRLGLDGEVRLGYGLRRLQTFPRAVQSLIPSTDDQFQVFGARLGWDTLDDPSFPRSGNLVVIDWSRASDLRSGSDLRRDAGLLVWENAQSIGRSSLSSSIRLGYGRGGASPLPLGGFLNLSGSPPETFTGDRTLLARMVFSHRLQAVSGVRVGVSFEAGDAFDRGETLRPSSLKRALSLLAGTDTPFGPVYIGWGRTFGVRSSLYLFLGRP